MSKTRDEFAGLTATECCTDCRRDRCVISGVGVCAHPGKTGLQAVHSNPPDRAAVERFERAKTALAHQQVAAKATA
jgi:hypothetical protein